MVIVHFEKLYPESQTKCHPFKRMSFIDILTDNYHVSTSSPMKFLKCDSYFLYECFEEFYPLFYCEKSVAIVPCTTLEGNQSVLASHFCDIAISFILNVLKPLNVHGILFVCIGKEDKTLISSFNSYLLKKKNDLANLIGEQMKVEVLEKLDQAGQNRVHHLVALHEILSLCIEKKSIDILFLQDVNRSAIYKSADKLHKIIISNCEWLKYGSPAINEFKKSISSMKNVLAHPSEIVTNIPPSIMSSAAKNLTPYLVNDDTRKKHKSLLESLEESYSEDIFSEKATSRYSNIVQSLMRFPYSTALEFLHITGDIISYREVLRETKRYVTKPSKLINKMNEMGENLTKADEICDYYLPFLDKGTSYYDSGHLIASELKCCPVDLQEMGLGLRIVKQTFILPHCLNRYTNRELQSPNSDQASIAYKFVHGIDNSLSWRIIQMFFLVYYHAKSYFVAKLYCNLIIIQCGTSELSVHVERNNFVIRLEHEFIDVEKQSNLFKKRMIWLFHKTVNPTSFEEVPFCEDVPENRNERKLSKCRTNTTESQKMDPTTIAVKEKKKKTIDDNTNIHYLELSIKDTVVPIVLRSESRIMIKMKEIGYCTSEKTVSRLLIYADEVLIHRDIIPVTDYNVKITPKEDYPTINLDFAPTIEYDKGSLLKVGMKFEGWDVETRQTRVASIAAIDPFENQILVHFDRMHDYSFWIDASESIHIYPVGWTEENEDKKTNSNRLQPPQDYDSSTFNWTDYLEYLNKTAIPKAWFDKLTNQLTRTYFSTALFTSACKLILENTRKLSGIMKTPTGSRQWILNTNVPLTRTKCFRLKDIEESKINFAYLLCEGSRPADMHIFTNLEREIKDISEENMLLFKKFTICQLARILQNVKDQRKARNYSKIASLYFYFCYLVKTHQLDDIAEFGKTSKTTKSLCKFIDKYFEQSEYFKDRNGKSSIACSYHKKRSQARDEGSFCEQIVSSLIEVLDTINSSNVKLFLSWPDRINGISSIDVDGIEDIPKHLGYIYKCMFLTNLTIENCGIKEIGDEIIHLSNTLETISLSGNPIVKMSDNFYKLRGLQRINVSNTKITNLSRQFLEFNALRDLNVSDNYLDEFPSFLSKLTSLIHLNVSGKEIYPFREKQALTKKDFENYLLSLNEHCVNIPNVRRVFEEKIINKEYIEGEQIEELHAQIFKEMPHIRKFPEIDDNSFQRLETLLLMNQNLLSIDPSIVKISRLKRIDLSNNPCLEEVPAISTNELRSISLKGCGSLKTPPKEIVAKGHFAVLGYLKRLSKGSVVCRRTKLMLVGLGGAGKTSLMKSLISEQPTKTPPDVTDGIDIVNWDVGSAIYILAWNVRLGHEHSGLKFWLSSIECHAPKTPVLVVGTHIDEVEKSELPEIELQRRYTQIKGFYYVSSLTNIGIDELRNDLIQITLKQKYMDEKIPKIWLDFEEILLKYRNSNCNVLEFSTIAKVAEEKCHISRSELVQCIEFLHELGAIQYFNNEFLKNRIVVNPQWIVDVMACVVSVKLSPIVDGKFYHKDIRSIWKDDQFPEDMLSWLLKLTEEFDLTFCLKQDKANLVPCLLPEREPEFEWKNLIESDDEIEMKMIYKFDYLPSGLFNRAQVRLHQFCDESLIWRKGMLLNKNIHRALMKQLNDTTVLVRAQGLKPDNVLFLVHEVFETLIAESFSGVRYDYSIPCPECLRYFSADPSMIPGQRIRKAIALKVPFLQCVENFHTMSITQLRSALPPENSEDFDIQLQKSVNELRNIKSNLCLSIIIMYSESDLPKSGLEYTVVGLPMLQRDLKNKGYDTKTINDMDNLSMEEMISTIKESQRTQLILTNDDKEWKSDFEVGPLCADDVFISMNSIDKYQLRFQDLIDNISKHETLSRTDWPPCFISYCWSNSLSAIAKGTKSTDKSKGLVDPRDLKDVLEKNDIKCWMDVEQVGQSGLFQDIAEGLKHARVVVVCVSDEYVNSRNCQMEFRFAAITLRLPIIFAVVGTGQDWVRSEIGMISLNHSRVNLQSPNYDLNDVAELVKPHLDNFDDIKNKEIALKEKIDQRAYKEILELAQRKLLRQVIGLANKINVGYLPHLPILDFECDQDSKIKNYQFVFLCEHEEGWHIPNEKASKQWDMSPGTSDENENLKLWSPYLARIFAILKFTSIELSILKFSIGQEIVNGLIEKSVQAEDISDSSFEKAYTQIMNSLNELVDIFLNEDSCLARCYTGSGKILWLCKEHQNLPRITKLELEEGDKGRALNSVESDRDQRFADRVKMANKVGAEKSVQLRGKFIGAQVAADSAVKLNKMKEADVAKNIEKSDSTIDIAETAKTVIGQSIAKEKQTSRACVIT
ncbi:DgyrCDS9493 [Dimorphilus gyrociliatus]|uniref:DgyrCDS9493 n=1 Tax=Dimorphilus gyrociliatus TaxID=2664684 RepID=A0A7I8VX45_9ANNE|nr:DgyrCDS9493 [Dimorphilus gyrociliatus]